MPMAALHPDITLILSNADATTALGERLAALLQAGDTLLLHGSIGAGKSHLARAFIQARLGRMEDVPSPTFTLVQTYDTDGPEVWHADLYRLTHPDEVLELGLGDAFASAICLIEWPDRLGSHTPGGALNLRLTDLGEGRAAHVWGGRPEIIEALRQRAA
jgi:tRNA threonylcarbamoyladenosine biosynthesis protein TsaE